LVVALEATSRTRGRPTVFSDETLERAAGYSYARRVHTRRGAQDLVYRMFAIAAIEHYCEAFPESAQTLAWLLRPRRRHTLLSELGRVAHPRSGASGELRWAEPEVAALIDLALEVAEKRPATKEGVALVRAGRLCGPADQEPQEPLLWGLEYPCQAMMFP
jgi:hypothetical protein